MDYKILITIGDINIYWFGTIIAFGLIVGFLAAVFMAKREKENIDHIVNIMFYGVISGIVFSRLLYVVMHLSLYRDNFAEVFFIWHGGLSLFGAIVGFLFAVYLYTKVEKFNFWYWADIISPAMAIGLSIGHWSNLASQEFFGRPVTDEYGIYVDYAFRPQGYEQYDYFFPVFMYHSAWLFAVFVLLTVLHFIKKKHELKSGSMFVTFIILYSAGRIFFDSLCLDAEKIGVIHLSYLTCALLLSTVLFSWYRKN